MIIKFGHCPSFSTFFPSYFVTPPFNLEQSLHIICCHSHVKNHALFCANGQKFLFLGGGTHLMFVLCSQTHSSHNIQVNNRIVIKESLGKSVYFHMSARHNHHSSHLILFSHAHYAI
jgi:hypothetical protein